LGYGVVAANAHIREKILLRPFEAVFVMVALGFVAHEVIGEVKWLDTIFHVIPARLNAVVPSVAFGWFEALWFLVLFPLVVWAIIGASASLLGHRAGIRSLLLSAATGAAPVVAAAHLAKAAAKVTSWGGFLRLALRDPKGIDTLHRISQHSLASPASFVGLSVVGWVILFATVFVAVKEWRNASALSKELVNAIRAGLLVSSLLFSAVLVTWII